MGELKYTTDPAGGRVPSEWRGVICLTISFVQPEFKIFPSLFLAWPKIRCLNLDWCMSLIAQLLPNACIGVNTREIKALSMSTREE